MIYELMFCIEEPHFPDVLLWLHNSTSLVAPCSSKGRRSLKLYINSIENHDETDVLLKMLSQGSDAKDAQQQQVFSWTRCCEPESQHQLDDVHIRILISCASTIIQFNTLAAAKVSVHPSIK